MLILLKAVVNAVKGNNFNVVKASACWVWKPKTKIVDHVSKYNSASTILKKFDYINAQGISKSTMKKLMEDMLLSERTPKEEKSKENIPLKLQNNVNIVSSTVNTGGTNGVNVVGKLPFDPDMPALEDVGTFDLSNKDEDDNIVADMNNMDTTIQMDVKSAFLYGKIKEEVYVCQPPGFEDLDFPDRVYNVKNALYRLHQAPRAWKELCNAFERLMHEKFQMSSMRELTFFLGLQVKQKNDGIFISQDKCVAKILKKFGFIEVKNAITPMETQKPLLKDEDGEEVDVHMYRSMIGSLIYLTSSRPGIMFTVCACARYQVNPKVLHLHAMKRIFRYLKGQPKLGLWYPKDSSFDLVAYTDSDYAGASLDNRRVLYELVLLFMSLKVSAEKAKKNVRLMMDKLFEMELELILLFWSTVMAKTINGEAQIHAWVDDKEIIITESSVRRDLRLADEEGVDWLPNSTIFENLELTGKPTRKNTQVPQPSGSIENVADEAVHKEWGDRLVRAATTASTLEAEQDSDNIDKTQSKATPNEASSSRTTSGGGPRCQDTMGDTIDQTRRVKKIKKKQRSRTHKLKRLYKVGLTARGDSSEDEQSLGDDASKQGKKINDIDADEDITLVNNQGDTKMFDVNGLHGEEVFVEKEVTDKEDKGKAIMIEEPVKPKKKEQIRLDEEAALKLQAEFDEEQRLAREKAKKELEANIDLIEECDDNQAKIDADYQLAQKLQTEE
uniref:Reverse transcriptase Ty1/copia-type domain-containing protein n=1 Tax=Tanacetum cinerariifolium TaxID=118510 RepID=A0A699GLS0_TANCI|nr:hypothetical protein [Tanacetum cinerariifolium]